VRFEVLQGLHCSPTLGKGFGGADASSDGDTANEGGRVSTIRADIMKPANMTFVVVCRLPPRAKI